MAGLKLTDQELFDVFFGRAATFRQFDSLEDRNHPLFFPTAEPWLQDFLVQNPEKVNERVLTAMDMVVAAALSDPPVGQLDARTIAQFQNIADLLEEYRIDISGHLVYDMVKWVTPNHPQTEEALQEAINDFTIDRDTVRLMYAMGFPDMSSDLWDSAFWNTLRNASKHLSHLEHAAQRFQTPVPSSYRR